MPKYYTSFISILNIISILNSFKNKRGDKVQMNYLDIESSTGIVEDKIKQNLKFKTGKFVWRIKFNIPLNPQSVNNVNLYVTTLKQAPLKTAIRYDAVKNYIEIEPLEPYAKSESYILHVSKNVKSKGGKKLNNDVKIQFKF